MHTSGGRSVGGAARYGLLAVGVSAVAAFAVWEGLQPRHSDASFASVAITAGAVVLTALVAGRGRQAARSTSWARAALVSLRHARTRPVYALGVVVWIVVIGAAIGWDLTSFVAQSHDLPTFSYLAGRITRWHWGRATVFALWLALGLVLAFGWLRRGPRGHKGTAATSPGGAPPEPGDVR